MHLNQVRAKAVNDITGQIIDASICVHTELGPGLLESAYEACLAFELWDRGFVVLQQVVQPVVYRGVALDAGYRLDLLVNGLVLDPYRKHIRRQRLEAIASLTEFRQSLLLHLVFRNSEFASWRVETLGKVSNVSGGLALSSRRDALSRSVTYLRVANVYRESLLLDEIKDVRLTAAEYAKTRLEKGDVLVVEGHGNRDAISRSAIWDGSIVSTRITSFAFAPIESC